MKTSSVTAGAVALGIALTSVVIGIGAAAPAVAATTCSGDRVTVQQLASGCAVASPTVVLPDGRQFVVPAAGTTVSAMPVAATGADDAGDVSITNTGRTGVAVRVDDVWSGSAAAVQQERTAVRARTAVPDRAGVVSRGAATTAATKAATSCTNTSYTRLGFRWTAPVQWSYNPNNQKVTGPSAIGAGADAWTGAVTACGRTINSTADQKHLGTLKQSMGVTATGGCGTANASSVVGWGSLPSGTLGVTCVWSRSGTAVETDQRYSTSVNWSAAATCSGDRFDLRGVATHEWGHAYGLGHTAKNSGLVMRPSATTCDTAQRGLGLGDLMGIDAIY
ncbi:matrixin [Curtobacterium sp. PhB172]|nr:matrixin [Curtobacterium sp. PhB172]